MYDDDEDEEAAEQEGMTDLQFKAYVRSLKGNLESALDAPDEKALRASISRLIAMLDASLEG